MIVCFFSIDMNVAVKFVALGIVIVLMIFSVILKQQAGASRRGRILNIVDVKLFVISGNSGILSKGV